jgi:hypothetical protein
VSFHLCQRPLPTTDTQFLCVRQNFNGHRQRAP